MFFDRSPNLKHQGCISMSEEVALITRLVWQRCVLSVRNWRSPLRYDFMKWYHLVWSKKILYLAQLWYFCCVPKINFNKGCQCHVAWHGMAPLLAPYWSCWDGNGVPSDVAWGAKLGCQKLAYYKVGCQLNLWVQSPIKYLVGVFFRGANCWSSFQIRVLEMMCIREKYKYNILRGKIGVALSS